MSFDSLGLAREYLRAVADEGYTEPTPVQRRAIPLVLEGRDVLVGAQTGTGKTAAFVLPMLQRLDAERRSTRAPRDARPAVRALVLTPTRELALQVEASIRTYGRYRPSRSAAIYGGVGFEPQARALRRGVPIVVATPGRLLDHVGQGTIDLSAVEILVLDEADRMLDMGFIRDIRRILELLPTVRQSLLFSATFSDDIRGLAAGLLIEPATVDVAPRNAAAELVEQVVIPVDTHRKRALLAHLVTSGRISQALVFTRTKHGANRLAEQLGREGIAAAAIHGNKSQSQRVRALNEFKLGRVDILVATDIAARGIDIEALPYVVNYELPLVAGDYVHRIGRTGRAGLGGKAISLVGPDEAELLRDIQRLIGQPLPSEHVAGFEPEGPVRSEPARGVRRPAADRSRDPRRRAAEPRDATRTSTFRGRNATSPAPFRSRNERSPMASRARIDGGSTPSQPVPTGRDDRGGRRPIALPGERLRRADGPAHFGRHHRAGTSKEGNR